MNPKGQGNTFWIVIVAVIALVVLVVLLLIFTGKVGMLETGLIACEGKGGVCTFDTMGDCAKTCEGLVPSRSYRSSVFTCPVEKGQCCCLGASEPQK